MEVVLRSPGPPRFDLDGRRGALRGEPIEPEPAEPAVHEPASREPDEAAVEEALALLSELSPPRSHRERVGEPPASPDRPRRGWLVDRGRAPRARHGAAASRPSPPAAPASTTAEDGGRGSGPPSGATAGGDTAPRSRLRSMPRPAYPSRCARLGHSGRVLVEVAVSPDGRVLKAKVVESAGCDELDEAAREAARAARFDAGTAGVTELVSVVFQR